MKLKVCDDLSLPVEISTSTLLIVGKRGSGKSSTATRLAEQLIGAGVQIAVLDPPDAWWGLKSSADGKSPGLPVYVFGGRHGDLPLESTAGALMADLLVDDGLNVVMSLRQFSNLERSRFCIDFAERLFQRNTRPLMLFCEEAHRLMPQNLKEYGKGSRVEEMLGRMLKLQTEGRTSGIGLTGITQRPATLSKTFTTQAEILLAHRTLGPQDRDAIEEWIAYHRQEDQKNEVLASLGELKTGDAWIWASDFPEEKPIGLKRVHFLQPETFDSRRTPKPGEQLREPKQLAPVDLELLKTKMASTIERAKADDPRELRKRIAALEKELKAGALDHPGLGVREKLPDHNLQLERGAARKAEQKFQALQREVKKRLRETDKILTAQGQRLDQALELIMDVQGALSGLILNQFGSDAGLEAMDANTPVEVVDSVPPSYAERDRNRRAVVAREHDKALAHAGAGNFNGKLPQGESAVLRALAQYPEGADRSQLSILTGYKRSTRDRYIQFLAQKGFALAVQDGLLRATPEGVMALGDDFEPLPTGLALQEYWLRRLPEGERRILEVLLEASGEPVMRETLTDATGYKRSTRDRYLQFLAARRLVESKGGGEVKAAALLFE